MRGWVLRTLFCLVLRSGEAWRARTLAGLLRGWRAGAMGSWRRFLERGRRCGRNWRRKICSRMRSQPHKTFLAPQCCPCPEPTQCHHDPSGTFHMHQSGFSVGSGAPAVLQRRFPATQGG